VRSCRAQSFSFTIFSASSSPADRSAGEHYALGPVQFLQCISDCQVRSLLQVERYQGLNCRGDHQSSKSLQGLTCRLCRPACRGIRLLARPRDQISIDHRAHPWLGQLPGLWDPSGLVSQNCGHLPQLQQLSICAVGNAHNHRSSRICLDILLRIHQDAYVANDSQALGQNVSQPRPSPHFQLYQVVEVDKSLFFA